jgi:hypothetical protein
MAGTIQTPSSTVTEIRPRSSKTAGRAHVDAFRGQLLRLPASGREDDRAGVVIQMRLQ